MSAALFAIVVLLGIGIFYYPDIRMILKSSGSTKTTKPQSVENTASAPDSVVSAPVELQQEESNQVVQEQVVPENDPSALTVRVTIGETPYNIVVADSSREAAFNSATVFCGEHAAALGIASDANLNQVCVEPLLGAILNTLYPAPSTASTAMDASATVEETPPPPAGESSPLASVPESRQLTLTVQGASQADNILLDLTVNNEMFTVAFNPAHLPDSDVAAHFCEYHREFFGLTSKDDLVACVSPIHKYISTRRMELYPQIPSVSPQ